MPQAPLGEHLLDIAKAQGEPGVQPDRVTDDFRREAVSFEGKLAHRSSLKPNSFCSQPTLCDNAALGIDPVHLGAVIVLNVAVGMITPPFGLNIFIGMTTFKVPYLEVAKSLLPFIVLALMVLALVTFVPTLVTWLPERVMG